jgi:hypothetical protein
MTWLSWASQATCKKCALEVWGDRLRQRDTQTMLHHIHTHIHTHTHQTHTDTHTHTIDTQMHNARLSSVTGPYTSQRDSHRSVHSGANLLRRRVSPSYLGCVLSKPFVLIRVCVCVCVCLCMYVCVQVCMFACAYMYGAVYDMCMSV